ncbi:MAG: hypothetical protein ACTSUN_06200 [Promethearchaeota archaeon]
MSHDLESERNGDIPRKFDCFIEKQPAHVNKAERGEGIKKTRIKNDPAENKPRIYITTS